MRYEYMNTVGNMSIRPAPNTSNSPLGFLMRGVTGYGDEISELPNGDKWVKISAGGDAVGWVAVIHLGKPYGILIDTGGATPTPVPSAVPDSFILTTPDGARAEYNFVRML